MTPAPITTALPLVEDAVLAALNAITPASPVYWGAAPVETTGRLRIPEAQANHIARVYVAQHQDGGGREAPLLGSRGWEGVVTVKVFSASQSRARAGFALAAAAMDALASPAGYALHADWLAPLDLPTIDRIYAAAGRWRVTLRRVAV